MSTSDVMLRREFLKKSAAGGTALVIGFYLPSKYEALAAAPTSEPVTVNAWVRIAPDDTVTIVIDKSEMGQGIVTSLAMLLAEELEFDWKKVKTEFAPAAPVYFNPVFGLQGTGGSTSVRASWEPLTKAGATAREMLIAAAAQAAVVRGTFGVSRGKRRGGAQRHQQTFGLRCIGGARRETSRACQSQIEGSERLQIYRQADEAAGHS